MIAKGIHVNWTSEDSTQYTGPDGMLIRAILGKHGELRLTYISDDTPPGDNPLVLGDVIIVNAREWMNYLPING